MKTLDLVTNEYWEHPDPKTTSLKAFRVWVGLLKKIKSACPK